VEVCVSVLLRVLQAEGTKPLFKPGVKSVAAPGDELVQRVVGELLEMVGVAGGCTSQCVPDIRKVPVLQTLKPDVSHIATDSQELRRPWPLAWTRDGLSLRCVERSLTSPRLARFPSLASAAPLVLLPYSVQVFAIILTLSTFNRGAAALSALLAFELSDRAASVPVISTFSPTCPESLLSSASSR